MGNQITSFKPKAQPDSGRKKKGLSVADPSGSASNLQLQADLPCVKDPGCECWLCARCPCCLCQQDRDAIRYRERRGLLGLGGHRHTTGAAVCLCQLCQLDSQNQFWVGLRNLTVPVPQKSAGTASRPTSSGRSWRSRLSALFRRCLPRPNPGPGPGKYSKLKLKSKVWLVTVVLTLGPWPLCWWIVHVYFSYCCPTSVCNAGPHQQRI